MDVDILKGLCGVDYYDVDKQASYFNKQWKPQDFAKVLKKICYSKSFFDEAIAAAEALGIQQCSYIVCQFDFAYDPKHANKVAEIAPVFLLER